MAKLTKPGLVPCTATSTSQGYVHLYQAGTAVTTLPQLRLACGLTQLKYIQTCVTGRYGNSMVLPQTVHPSLHCLYQHTVFWSRQTQSGVFYSDIPAIAPF